MAKRKESEVIERGKLWHGFWTTDQGIDLQRFFEEQEKLGKEAVFQLMTESRYEQSKTAGFKLAGILAVKEYINDSILEMQKEINEEDSQPEVPSHVRSYF